jgi:dolichyl-diphosphooligosaccharide--protein glycosyltransferase
MLVLAPAVCCIAAVALSEMMTILTGSVRFGLTSQTDGKALDKQASAAAAAAADSDAVVPATPAKGDKGDKKAKGDKKDKSEKKREKSESKTWKQYAISPMVALFGLGGVMFMLCFYTVHCVWLSADGYSAPSIVMQTVRP